MSQSLNTEQKIEKEIISAENNIEIGDYYDSKYTAGYNRLVKNLRVFLNEQAI